MCYSRPASPSARPTAEHGDSAPMPAALLLNSHFHHSQGDPEVLLQAVLQLANPSEEGRLVQAVTVPWFKIMEMIRKNPESIYQINPFQWEELIAGAYHAQGFEVILTPRSGDKGRDVIATRNGVGSIRIFDQVKAYKPGHVVPANDVRAMLGVLSGAQNVSKAVITTTSGFAPRIEQDDFIKPFMPYRLELKPREVLLPWLNEIAQNATR